MTLTRTMLVSALMGGSSVLAVAVTPAIAQDGEAASNDVIYVIGRGREENIQDVPISQTAFTAETISDARIDQVDDFFALTPGVTFANAQDAGTNFITIRGISQVRNGEAPVAVIVDDVLQVNSRSFDQALFDLESVEILRGPQGALYGRNATGGAIIITTKGPSDEFEGYAQATYGKSDELSFEGSVSIPLIDDKLGLRLSARHYDREGYFENIIRPEKEGYHEEFNFRGHLSYQASDDLRIDLRGSHTSTDADALLYTFQGVSTDPTTGEVDGFPGISDADFVTRRFSANNRGNDRRDHTQASLRIQYETEWATVRSVTAYDKIEQSAYSDQFPYTANTTANPGLSFFDGIQSQHIDVEAISQELRVTSRDDQKLRWMVGGYFVATDRFINSSIYDDLGNGLPTLSRRDFVFDALAPQTSFIADDNDNTAWALFFNAAYDITDRLELAFAGRYDKDEREQTVDPDQGNYAGGAFVSPTGVPGSVNSADFSLFQPKVTLRYAALDNVNVYASWGKGFRSGQFNQNGVGAVAAGAGVSGVSDLLPQEETSTYELGVKTTLMDGVTLNASGYRTDVENAPYFVFIGAVSAQVLVPIDEIKIWGGEIEFTANLYDGLDFHTSFGLADSEIEAYTVNSLAIGNNAPYVAKTTFNAGFQYRAPITSTLGLFGRADYERRGEQFWDPENTTSRSALNLLNLRAGIEDNDGGWALTASIDNVTDEVYNSEWVLGGFAHAGLPRVWRLDLRMNF